MVDDETLTVYTFVNYENSYVAYGKEPMLLTVYWRSLSDSLHRESAMKFPGCLRFMTEAVVSEPKKLTFATIEKKYGKQIKLKQSSPIG